MQQLGIEHKKSTSKNQEDEQVEAVEIRRKERIAALVSSRRMYRLENTNIFYIETPKTILYIIADILLLQKTTSVHVKISNSMDR